MHKSIIIIIFGLLSLIITSCSSHQTKSRIPSSTTKEDKSSGSELLSNSDSFTGLFTLKNNSNTKEPYSCSYWGDEVEFIKTSKMVSLTRVYDGHDRDSISKVFENKNTTRKIYGVTQEIKIIDFSENLVKMAIKESREEGSATYVQTFILKGDELILKIEDVNYNGAKTHFYHFLSFLTEGHWGAMRIPGAICTYELTKE